MLSLHKKQKRIARLVAISVLAIPAITFGIGHIKRINDVQAISGFTDSNFYVCVKNTYQYLYPDDEIPGTGLTEEQLSRITHLTCNNKSISSIAGAVYLTNIIQLSMNNNQITDIASLANLTGLTDIYLNNNRITDLTPLANLTALKTLSMDNNKIESVSPIANLTNLETLGLSHNKIESVSPMANLTKLTRLGLADNQISNISVVNNMTNLTIINLGSNNISDISALSNILDDCVEITLEKNAIFDFSPIMNKTCAYSYAGSQKTSTTVDTKTASLPKLFEQVKDNTGIDGTIAQKLYTTSILLQNATMNPDGESITINNLSSPAKVIISGNNTIVYGSEFTVNFKSNLTGIYAPTAISGLANGTAKTATALGLPTTVTAQIKNDITVDLPVTWNIDDISYDPTSKEAQTFTVSGNITLPDYITNEDDIPLNSLVTVSVLAATPDPSDDTADDNQPSDDQKNETATPDTGANTNSEQGGSAMTPILNIIISVILVLFGLGHYIIIKTRR